MNRITNIQNFILTGNGCDGTLALASLFIPGYNPFMKNKVQLIKTMLFIVFFFSGISALIYQVIWIKMLGQVFGLTLFAVTTVLTAFMAGLALGSYFFGRFIDKAGDQLAVFLLLELGIGVFALLFPLLLKLLTSLYTALASALQPDLYADNLFRFIFSFILLLIPTTLMGGTLPVLSKYYVKNADQLAGNVGNLYAVNNAGAIVGCLAASFILIRITGLAGCLYLAAGINIAAAGVMFVIRKQAQTPAADDARAGVPKAAPGRKSSRGEAESYLRPVLRLVLWVFALEGFTTLAYEVIWTRILLGISFDRSVYFYAVVVLAFIAGLSLGSFIAARFADRNKNLVFLLGVIEIVIGIAACAVMIFFVQISRYLTEARLQYTEPWLFSLGKEYLIFFLLMLGPAALMGMTFPVVARIYTTNMEKLGEKLGLIGCLDTIGSIFGSFAAGFILIPFLGVVKAVLVTAGLNVLLGLALVVFNPGARPKVKAIAVAAALCAAVPVFMLVPRENYFRHWQTETEGDNLVYYKEGMGSTVAVARKFDGVKELAIDGAVTAIAEYGDIRVHKLLAYLPYLLCEKPEKALVVGFGMGITTRALLQEDMEQVTCVEICPEIIEGSARYFLDENRNVLQEPKLRVVIEDGRSFLTVAREKYDVITTNAVHPRLSINIYTREFYELCRNSLTPDGVMCQWMATNWLSEAEYKMLLKSFTAVFPHTSLWISNIGHVLLVGTPGPLKIDFRKFSTKLRTAQVQEDLKGVHLDDPCAFLALYGCGPDELEPYLRNTQPNTDNYPLPEFSRYISPFPNLKTTEEILKYRRAAAGIVFNWAEPGDAEKLARYVEAERSFLKARYAYFAAPAENVTAELEKAVQLNPYNYIFYHTAGAEYLKTGKYLQAAEAYRKAITLSLQNPLGYLDLVNACFKTEDYDTAFAAVRQALSLDAENGLAHYYLSILYRLTEQLEPALHELEIVSRGFSSFKNAHFELGEVYYMLGKYKEAKAAFIRYAQMVKNDKDVEFILEELKKLGY